MAIDATLGVTDLVEALHERVARTPTALGGEAGRAVRQVTRRVYGAIRGTTRVVGSALDAALARLGPLVGALPDLPQRDALVAALNGLIGDYLAETGNPLAIPMRLRDGAGALELRRDALAAALPAASATVVVAVHGLCMNDRQWSRAGHDHRVALARDLRASVVSLHYNSGLHVSTNGRELADLLEAMLAAWPVRVERLIVLGHSMGGLVARSAAHYGALAGQRWTAALDALAFLGTPHHGSPFERGGHAIDVLLESVPYAKPFARLGRVRSAGITDLRHGSVVDDDWQGRDRFARLAIVRHPIPLPAGVACTAIAGSLSASASGAGKRWRGDGVVSVASALGRHRNPRFELAIPARRRWVAPSTGHLALLASPAVYERLRSALLQRR